jgi:hypothetical protein
VLGHSIAATWLYDDDSDVLEPAVWTDTADEIVGDHPTFGPHDPSISWATFESGEAVYVADTYAETEHHNPESPILSELVLPLGRYGLLNIGATERDAFGEADLAVARLWAATVTMVFVRIERERQLRVREREILRERDRLEEFASLVSHDLRSPLNVAAGNLDLIRERLRDEGGDASEVDALARALARMEALVEDMLALARQGAAIDETEGVSLAAVAAESWEAVDSETAELVVAGEFDLQADRSRLRQALENLFVNAVAHVGGPSVSRSARSLTVRASTSPTTAPAFPPTAATRCSTPASRQIRRGRGSGSKSFRRWPTPTAGRSASATAAQAAHASSSTASNPSRPTDSRASLFINRESTRRSLIKRRGARL